jgi:hypothetical protein
MVSLVTPSTQAVIQPNSTAAARTKPFLNRCVEDLSPDKVAGFEKKADRWQILTVVSTIAFFALAIGAFIATSVLAPIYLPVAGIGSLLLAFLVVPQVQKFQEWAKAAQDEGNKYKAIQRYYADLTTKNSHELTIILQGMGINGMQVRQDLTRLNPLLAQAKFLEEENRKCMQLKDDFIRQAQQLTKPDDLKQRVMMHVDALLNEKKALHAKIKNAFVNAVLHNPDSNIGSLEDIATFSKINFTEQLLLNAMNDPSANQFLTFKNRNHAPITLNDVKMSSVAQLGQRIFAAMAA